MKWGEDELYGGDDVGNEFSQGYFIDYPDYDESIRHEPEPNLKQEPFTMRDIYELIEYLMKTTENKEIKTKSKLVLDQLNRDICWERES